MRKKLLLAGGLTALASFSFALVTGDPSADGWIKGGNSFDQGTYVDGAALYSYDTYAQNFIVQAGSQLHISDSTWTWQPGDQILGYGGKIVTAPAVNGWGIPLSDNNSAMTHNMRVSIKVGSSSTSWAPSTVAPTSGDGVSNFLNGSGGKGSVMFNASAGFFVNNAGGTLHVSSAVYVWDGSDDKGISSKAGRMIFVKDANNVVQSWQGMLNVSLLNRLYGTQYGTLPQVGNRTVTTLQLGPNATPLNQQSALAPDAVPEPATMAVLGMGALALLRRRRNS